MAEKLLESLRDGKYVVAGLVTWSVDSFLCIS
jgi:hypothetical protein